LAEAKDFVLNCCGFLSFLWLGVLITLGNTTHYTSEHVNHIHELNKLLLKQPLFKDSGKHLWADRLH